MLENDFDVMVVNGTAMLGWFKEAPKGSAMHKLYKRMQKDPSLLPLDFTDAKKQLRVRFI